MFAFLRNKSNIIIIVVLAIIFVLHITLPGDLNQRKDVVKKHFTNLLQQTYFDIDYVQDHLEEFDQFDSRLIQYIRYRHLSPPSKKPYYLKEVIKNAKAKYEDEFSKWVVNFFKNKVRSSPLIFWNNLIKYRKIPNRLPASIYSADILDHRRLYVYKEKGCIQDRASIWDFTKNGIFIEAGANEGERASHTLYLERELAWTGLLIECNPTTVPYLKSHHRKTWIADVCLSPTTTPGMLNFSNPVGWEFSGTFRKPWNVPKKHVWKWFDVQTYPFYSVLAALGWTEIDFFSFDIEGSELSVFKTFPFDMVIFKVMIVEVSFYTKAEKSELQELLENNGYHLAKKINLDWVFVHQSVLHMLPK